MIIKSNRNENGHDKSPRKITGQTVLACLVGFFVVVVGVNLVLVKAAIQTFGGVETDSSYRAGLVFEQDIAEARAQEARHWQVSARLAPATDGMVGVELSTLDESGRSIAGLGAMMRLVHPADRRLDRVIAMSEVSPGQFRGRTDAGRGEWDLSIELTRGEERLFRSKNRVSVR